MIGPVERAGLKNIIERTVLLQQPTVLEASELISKMKPVPRATGHSFQEKNSAIARRS